MSEAGSEELDPHERLMLEMLDKAKAERDAFKAKYEVESRRNTKLELDLETSRAEVMKLKGTIVSAQGLLQSTDTEMQALWKIAVAAKNAAGWIGLKPVDTITFGVARQAAKSLDEALKGVRWPVPG
jgi:hypothetical protein